MPRQFFTVADVTAALELAAGDLKTAAGLLSCSTTGLSAFARKHGMGGLLVARKKGGPRRPRGPCPAAPACDCGRCVVCGVALVLPFVPVRPKFCDACMEPAAARSRHNPARHVADDMDGTWDDAVRASEEDR